MDKVVLWTDLVGSLQQGAKGPQWIIRDSHLQKWSLNINKKNKSSGYDLIFTYKVNNSWIPNPGNPITIAHVGARDRLEVSVMEGVEERMLSIDCKKHAFLLVPFYDSIVSLPSKEKEEIEKVMSSGISKRAINFVLETLEDLNSREAATREESRQQKKKQAEGILKSKTDEGGSSIGLKPKAKGKKPEELTASLETERRKPHEVVPHVDTETQNTERDAGDAGSGRKKKAKRALSPEKKTKQKKMKPDVVMHEDTPLVLTQAEKGRVISQGQQPSLEEAALDRKKFLQLFGHIYPFGAESIFRVPIKQMKGAKAYQVTRPLDPSGVNLMKNYLIQTPPAWPQHNLCLMPKFKKGETWREGMTWDDIKNMQFAIINGQHTVAASTEIIAHRDTDPKLKEKLKVWPCTIVWTEDPSMTVRLSYTLNNSNSFNKFTPTWTTQILYCRRVWVKLNKPEKQRANASEATQDPEKALAWKVCYSAPLIHLTSQVLIMASHHFHSIE